MSSTKSRDANEEERALKELGAFLQEQEEVMAAEVEGDPFGPLTDQEQGALTASLLSRLGGADEDSVRPATRADPAIPAIPAIPARPALHGKVVRLPSPPQRRWQVAATAVSLAAAALLVFWPRSETSELPAYALVLPSADASHRGSSQAEEQPKAEVPTYVLGRELEVLLRPATRVDPSVEARIFVEGKGGKLEQLGLQPEHVPGGAILFRVPTGEGTALSQPASMRLHFVLAAAGSGPRELTSQAAIPKQAQHLIFPLRLIRQSSLDPQAPLRPNP